MLPVRMKFYKSVTTLVRNNFTTIVEQNLLTTENIFCVKKRKLWIENLTCFKMKSFLLIQVANKHRTKIS